MISLTRRAYKPGLTINPNRMAWRPYENLIDGELDNRTAGKVTGWIRFFRNGKRSLKVIIDLAGDFHEEIRGKVIRFRNPSPSDPSEEPDQSGTNMEGFSRVQRGEVGDITAGLPLGPWTEELAQRLMAKNEIIWDEIGLKGLERKQRRQELAERYHAHIEAGDPYYSYVPYPYIEWYSEANGRVVLELDPSQVEIIDGGAPPGEKTPAQLVGAQRKREQAMVNFLAGMVKELSEKNRKQGGDGNVTGIVVG